VVLVALVVALVVAVACLVISAQEHPINLGLTTAPMFAVVVVVDMGLVIVPLLMLLNVLETFSIHS